MHPCRRRNRIRAALEPIKRALNDSEESIRSYAFIGLERGNKAQRLSPQLAAGLIDTVESLLRQDRNVDQAASCYMYLDRDRGIKLLTSDEILDPQKDGTFKILRVLSTAGIEVSRDRLRLLIEAYSAREMKYPNDYAMGEALSLLGRLKDSRDTELLQAQSESNNEKVASGAIQGLLAIYDLDDFRSKLSERERKDGFEALTHEQQLYFAVFMYDAEVCNGGHSQYLFNSSGDDWKLALDGLNEMGFQERTLIFKQALSYFGKAGPSSNREQRMVQLASVFDKHEEEYNALDTSYYRLKNEPVEVFLKRYVLRHPDAFK